MCFRPAMHRLAPLIATALAMVGFATMSSVRAADVAKAVLILDASGSMWGRVEGVAKITIAKRVVGGLLNGLPDNHELGLTVYGHRVKGNCADIETMVPPGQNTRNAIRTALSSISPKGKTPLSDAVLIAADVLDFKKTPGTVILITDGMETCGRDPCALARALNSEGLNFTAHVIGFDLAKVDRPKLQCLADETGGRFLTADNADELSDALTSVAVPPPPPPTAIELPEPEKTKLRAQFDARDRNGLIFSTLEWSLFGPDGAVVEGHRQNQLVVDLVAGVEYRIVARKPDTAESVELTFTATGDGFTFTRGLVFP